MMEQLARLYRRPPVWDRTDAGRQLADRLDNYRGRDILVLGIPRGGVAVAAEVARRLNAELDVIVARKLGSPVSRELALGAVTANGGLFLNEEVLDMEVRPTYLNAIIATERAEARRGEAALRGIRPKAPIEGRVVILVDDGLATGATMRAAIRSVRKAHPGRLIVAVPVGAAETCELLRSEADDVICVHQPEPFFGIGLHYADFTQTTDEEVRHFLEEASERRPSVSNGTAS